MIVVMKISNIKLTDLMLMSSVVELVVTLGSCLLTLAASFRAEDGTVS